MELGHRQRWPFFAYGGASEAIVTSSLCPKEQPKHKLSAHQGDDRSRIPVSLECLLGQSRWLTWSYLPPKVARSGQGWFVSACWRNL